MVKVAVRGSNISTIDFSLIDKKGPKVAQMISDRSGAGGEFLGWLDYASTLPKEEIQRVIDTANEIRKNFDALVVCGIGGSYLGARAVIEAINGLFPTDKFEIIYFGNTLSADYSAQVLNHLKKKKFAVNVISKSGTTTETAVAFRLLKNLLKEQYGESDYAKAIFATTDKCRGALKTEADAKGYTSFVIPDNIGGRFSVITPVGLLPIAVAGINIQDFIDGVIAGEEEYSNADYKKNNAYLYGAMRYLMNIQYRKSSEMYVTYNLQYQMICEWLNPLVIALE